MPETYPFPKAIFSLFIYIPIFTVDRIKMNPKLPAYRQHEQWPQQLPPL